MVSFTVVILNAALAVLSDKGLCVCVWGGGGVGSCDPQDPPPPPGSGHEIECGVHPEHEGIYTPVYMRILI